MDRWLLHGDFCWRPEYRLLAFNLAAQIITYYEQSKLSFLFDFQWLHATSKALLQMLAKLNLRFETFLWVFLVRKSSPREAYLTLFLLESPCHSYLQILRFQIQCLLWMIVETSVQSLKRTRQLFRIILPMLLG